MRAAVKRQTHSGRFINTEECVSPETALEGYLGHFSSPFTVRGLNVGGPADLVLLTRPWSEARDRLDSEDVRMTWCHGEATFEREILSDAE
jgi:predicted amidohydrolase YtcJ